MTGAEGISSAASSYFLQSLQSTPKVSGSLSGGEGAGGMSGGEGAGAVSASISPMGQLVSNLQQLQTQDPTKFQQVVGQIATELQTAAQQSGQTGPSSSTQQPGQAGTSNFLTQLAASFKAIANGGSLSQLQAQHHHGHHQMYDSTGQSVSTTPTSPSTTSPAGSANSTSGSNIQQLFATITSQVAQALGS